MPPSAKESSGTYRHAKVLAHRPSRCRGERPAVLSLEGAWNANLDLEVDGVGVGPAVRGMARAIK